MIDLIRMAWRNCLRHPLRSLLTAIGVAIALIAFTIINTMVDSWYSGVRASAKDRLITRNRVSLIFYLPLSYEHQVRTTPGVLKVGYGNWFGGIYRDERYRFAQFAISPEYLDVYSDYVMSPEQRQAWMNDRTGAVIGEELAEKYGWKIGDVVQLKGTIFPTPAPWQFTIRAIFKGRQDNTQTRVMFFHWEYLNERNRAEIQRQPDNVGFFAITVAPGFEPAVVARAIDAQFANSYAESITESETAFQQSFISLSSTIILVLQVVSAVVLVIMALVLTNTLLMSTREQFRELSILRVLGFRIKHLIAVMLGEGLIITGVGCAVWAVAMTIIFSLPAKTILGDLSQFFPIFRLAPSMMILAPLLSVTLAIVAVLPALRSLFRMRLQEGLRAA